jgi:hypothetical protein
MLTLTHTRHAGWVFLTVLLVLSGTFALPQSITLTGRVVDATTKQPLPYASVGVAGSRLGTTANEEGRFRLALPKSRLPATLAVSYMGYANGQQRVTDATESLLITLQPGDKTLREVVVMPDSSLRVLLQSAYRRIEANYVTRPTQLSCFFREAMKTTRGEYAYFGEALLNGYVSGYQNSTEEGQFEVVRSRVNQFPGYDTLKLVRFYASVFSFLTGDPVKQRRRYIQPDFKRYTYHLDEMSEYNGRPVYVVSYRSKAKSDTVEAARSGRFFIDKNSLAYIAFELEGNPTERDGSIVRKGFKTSIRYRQVGTKWHLQHIVYEREYDQPNNKRTLLLALEGLVSDIDTLNAIPIPYNKRLAYGAVFSSLKTDSTTTTTWNTQTIIEPTQPLLMSMQQAATEIRTQPQAVPYRVPQPTAKQPWRAVLTSLYSHLEVRQSLLWLPYQAGSQPTTLVWPGGPPTEAVSPGTVWPVGYAAFNIGYHLTNRWLLAYNRGNTFQQLADLHSAAFTLSYAILLKRRGNPFLIRPGLGYFSQSLYRDMATAQTAQLELSGETLRADRLMLAVGERHRGLRYALRFDYKLSGRRWLFAEVGYHQSLARQLRLQATERSGFFLFRGKASAPLAELGATIRQNATTLSAMPDFRPIMAEIGVRWSFQ